MLRYLKTHLLTLAVLVTVTAVTALPAGAASCSQPLSDCGGCPRSAAFDETAARLLARLQQELTDRMLCVPAPCGQSKPNACSTTGATTAAPTTATTATTTTAATEATTSTATTTTTAATTTATVPSSCPPETGCTTAPADPLAWLREWLATLATRQQTTAASTRPTAAPTAPAGTDSVSAYERQVAELVNEIRTSYGLAPLQINEQLCGVARMKSQDMRDKGYFSHTSPTYGSPFDMMKRFGVTYRAAGENIAMGYPTPEAVVDGWMNSEGHRANILNANFKEIGVGYVSSGHYWTQMFIG